jgi:uncharacterized protein YkwD
MTRREELDRAAEEALARAALSRGWINPSQYQAALEEFRRSQRAMSNILVEKKFLTPAQAKQLASPPGSHRRWILILGGIAGAIAILLVLILATAGARPPAREKRIAPADRGTEDAILQLIRAGRLQEADRRMSDKRSELDPEAHARLRQAMIPVAEEFYRIADATIQRRLAAGEYDAALAELDALKDRLSCIPEIVARIQTEQATIRRQAGDYDASDRFRSLEELIRVFEEHKQYERAIAILESALKSASDNPLLVRKIEDRLATLKSRLPAQTPAEVRPAPTPTTTEPPLPAPPPSDPPIVRKPVPEDPPAPLQPSKPPEPAPAPPTPEPPPDPTPPSAPAEPTLNPLQSRVRTAIESGEIREISFRGKKLVPIRVDGHGIVTAFGKIAWTDLSHDQIAEELIGALKGAALLELGRLLHEFREPSAAERALYRYQQDTQAAQSDIDRILAEWAGLPVVPTGGYAWNARRRRWEDSASRSDPAAVAEMEKILKSLSNVADLPYLERQLVRISAQLELDESSAGSRDEMGIVAAEALLKLRSEIVAKLRKAAPRACAGKTADAARLLEAARRECLRILRDSGIYVTKDQPNYEQGLRTYQKAKGALLRIWNGRWHTQVDATLGALAQMVERINTFLREPLRSPAGQELTAEALDDLIAEAAGKEDALSVRRYALTDSQRALYAYNDRVEKYNHESYRTRDLSGTGAPEDTLQNVDVLNAWREVLGLKKLFLDKRLQKAAQLHAQDQEKADDLWHEGKNGTPKSRCEAQGYVGSVGENLARGDRTGAEVHEGWDQSPEHCRDQCEDAWTCIGVGRSGVFWVQNFGDAAPPTIIGNPR